MSAAVVIMPAILLTATRATGYIVVPHLRPTVASIVAIRIMQATPRIISSCWGRFLTRHRSLKFTAILNPWPGVLQCEQVNTAEGVDVTAITESRPFAFREGPFRIALFAYIFRIVITVRSSVKSSSASAL